jgi:hypothetical protein
MWSADVSSSRLGDCLIMSAGLRAVSLLLVLVACSCAADPEQQSETPSGPAAGSALDAVDGLIGAIKEPDFDTAAGLAVPGQAALASLAEGATFGEVARALEEGDQDVAANFWAGFAQGSGSFLAGNVATSEDGVLSEGGLDFHTVTVSPADSGSRTILVREDDGYRIDIFASFGAGLAARMNGPVERLLTTQTAEARLILAELQEIVPSLLVAAGLPDTTPEMSQQILALVEVITRVA